MQQFVLQIDETIKQEKYSLYDMFKAIDTDGSNSIEPDEFQQLFSTMNINFNKG